MNNNILHKVQLYTGTSEPKNITYLMAVTIWSDLILDSNESNVTVQST